VSIAFLSLVLLSACQDDPAGVRPSSTDSGLAPSGARQTVGTLPVRTQGTLQATAGDLVLPYFGSVRADGVIAFGVENTGTGWAGVFLHSGTGGLPALLAQNGAQTSGSAFEALTAGTGRAAYLHIDNPTSGSDALAVTTRGSGNALLATNTGTGRAGRFDVLNGASSSNALVATTSGHGMALYGSTSGDGDAVYGLSTGTGGVALLQSSNPNSTQPALTVSHSGRAAAVNITTAGSGTVLVANHGGPSGALAVFQLNGVNKIRFSRTGRGYFDGGTQSGGADVAEAFAVEGRVRDYGPGDVLVISKSSDRRVEKSGEPYSTRVIGVYATRPGMLLTERGIDARLDDLVPVGVVGVIPTRVSAENGAIHRGDLLVTASTRSHAMRANSDRLRFGMVIGKALAEFAGPGTGVIPVFVNVK
jgi:hypothetical protein